MSSTNARPPRKQNTALLRAVPGMRHREGGFTLVEMMLAIAVLGIALAAIGGLIVSNLQLRRTSIRSTDAYQLAASYLDSIKRGWTVLDNYIAEPRQSLGLLPDLPADARATDYTFELNVRCLELDAVATSCASARNPELRELHLVVMDVDGRVVADVVTEVGRPFDPAGQRTGNL